MKIVNKYAYPEWDNYYCNNLEYTSYGYPTRELIEKNFINDYFQKKEKNNSIDIGAHIGFHSLYFSELFNNVYSFEANSQNYECLKYNTKLKTNINCYNFAIGEMSSHGKIIIPWDFPIKENINSGMGYITSGDDVEIHSLDSLKLDNISFIKIDVEGYEYFVLKGAMETLKNNKILLMFELNGHESRYNIRYENIHELLISLNYKCIKKLDQNYFYEN